MLCNNERCKLLPSFSQWHRHSQDGGKGCVSGHSPSLPAGTDSRGTSQWWSLGQLVVAFVNRKLLKWHLQALGMGTEGERQECHRHHLPHIHVHRHNCTHLPKSEHIASREAHIGFFPPKKDSPFFGMASQTHASSWKPSFPLSRLPHHTWLLMKLHHFQTKQLFTLQ